MDIWLRREVIKMCEVVLFAGTAEGRMLAEFLDRHRIRAHVCVATGYGGQLLSGKHYLHISAERLDIDRMAALMAEKDKPLVIDATHPYAEEATANIRAACARTGASYVRVLRENELPKDGSGCVYTDSIEEAIAFLEGTEGNILASTGSKDASAYTALSKWQQRVFLRVLSLPEVVRQCAELGFQGKNLLCMQGPFSKEMNAATLRQYGCRYLVTKMSGKQGGFSEKLEAARECGCTCVIVGRPSAEKGISVNECKRLLCEKFSVKSQAQISLVGVGMGGAGSLTKEAEEVLCEAELLIGAKRMTASCVRQGQDVYEEYDSRKIASYIEKHPEYEKIAIVLSGDTGFYSGAKKLLSLLPPDVRVVCGVSSPAYFMSRIKRSWEDVLITSAHGRDVSLALLAKYHPKVFAIMGTKDGISKLAWSLTEMGLEQVTIYTGERLSYEDEKVRSGKPADFIGYEADALSVVYIENPDYTAEAATHGIADDQFIRDKVPMTKAEVRAVSLAKLGLNRDSVCYDVGAGTGSVAVEMALRAPFGKVYAIEKKPEAAELLYKNRQKFAAENLQIVRGTAPEALEALEAPTHAFIGGSSGNMKPIMEALLEKNPSVRIVVNCIALETLAETLNCLRELPLKNTEIVQMSVGKAKEIGAYHMMMGENPIYILSCTGAGKEETERES